jgi:N-acetylglucosamine kinase-like BadF-type ATPase
MRSASIIVCASVVWSARALHMSVIMQGLALSGVEGDPQDEQIVRGLLERHADLGVDVYDITGDAVGTVHAAGGSCTCSAHMRTCCAGAVLIAGTGSTARMLNTDGHVYSAGGHAHLISEGSGRRAKLCAHTCLATHLALSGVRCVFGVHDDMRPTTPHSVHTLRAAMFDFFDVQNIQGMYAHLYASWNRAHFARFAVRIVEGAYTCACSTVPPFSRTKGRCAEYSTAQRQQSRTRTLFGGDCETC